MEGIVLSFQDEGEEDRGALLLFSRTISAVNSDTIFSQGARRSILDEIKRKCLLSVTSTFRIRWDLFILLLTLANSFTVPFEIAFLEENMSTDRLVVNLVITTAYIVDVIIQCRSTYLDETGAEIISPKIIARSYFSSGRLAVDLLAAIPYEFLDLVNSSHIRLFSLLKMLRLMRLGKVIRFMRTNDKTKLRMELVQLIIFFLLYLHLQACFWFMLTKAGGVYVPPSQYVRGIDVLEGGLWLEYAYSLYMSVYLLAAAEIGPRTPWECIVSGLFVLSGQLFQAFMFGKIAVVLFNLNAKIAESVEIQDAAATSMLNMRLPVQLQSKIISYLMVTHADSMDQNEFDNFFRILPPSLQQEVRSEVFKSSLMLDSVLSAHPGVFGSVLRRLTNMYCRPEQSVIAQGDIAKELYFVMKGVCEVTVLDEHKEEHHVSLLGRGTHFGEIALIYNSVRTATVRTRGHATLAVLSKKDFVALSQRYRKLVMMFRDSAAKYEDPWRKFIISTLIQCKALQNLPTKVLKEISYTVKPSHIEANAYICKEGDVADRITFIVDGMVEIYLPVNDMRLMTFPSNAKLTRDLQMVNKLRFRRGSLMALKKTKDMRYMVKISMDKLGIGSVILPNLPLLKEKVHFYAKSTEPTALLCLDMRLLDTLCKKLPDLQEAIRAYRQLLLSCKSTNPLYYINQTALDYEKSIPDSATHTEVSLWNAKITIRRCVIGRVLRQRDARERGTSDMWMMSRKLKAIMQAQIIGDDELAEKVRRAAMPGSGEIVMSALKLLTREEASRPLVAQLAYQTTKMRFVIANLPKQLKAVYDEVSIVAYQRSQIHDDLEHLRALIQLTLRLCEFSL